MGQRHSRSTINKHLPKLGSTGKSTTANKDGTGAVPTFGKNECIDPADFIIKGLKDQVVVREPDSIQGQQFIIEECVGCDLYILDHTDQVTVDDCVDCRIVLGPSESSVFIRDCRGCKVVVASRQLRLRDCHDLDLLVFCVTRPVIESSKDLRFGCYSYNYFSLASQFDEAKLNVWDNRWSEIYDFTPGSGNYTYLPVDKQTHKGIIKPLEAEVASRVGYSNDDPAVVLVDPTEDPNNAVVPKTVGIGHRCVNDDSKKKDKVALLIVNIEHGVAKGMDVIKTILKVIPGTTFIQTRTITLTVKQAEEIFGSDNKDLIRACTPSAKKPTKGKAKGPPPPTACLAIEIRLPQAVGEETAPVEWRLDAALKEVFPPTQVGVDARYHVGWKEPEIIHVFERWRPVDN